LAASEKISAVQKSFKPGAVAYQWTNQFDVAS